MLTLSAYYDSAKITTDNGVHTPSINASKPPNYLGKNTFNWLAIFHSVYFLLQALYFFG